jgi:hypothetical protein
MSADRENRFQASPWPPGCYTRLPSTSGLTSPSLSVSWSTSFTSASMCLSRTVICVTIHSYQHHCKHLPSTSGPISLYLCLTPWSKSFNSVSMCLSRTVICVTIHSYERHCKHLPSTSGPISLYLCLTPWSKSFNSVSMFLSRTVICVTMHTSPLYLAPLSISVSVCSWSKFSLLFLSVCFAQLSVSL